MIIPLFRKKKEEETPRELKVTKKVIVLDTRTYQLSNITSVGVQKLESDLPFNSRLRKSFDPKQVKKDKEKIKKWLPSNRKRKTKGTISSILIAGIFATVIFISYPEVFVAVVIALFSLLLLLIVIRALQQPKEQYALILETSAASKALLISENKSFLTKIVEKVREYMEDSGVPTSYTFNLQQDKSIRIGGNFSGQASTGDDNQFS